MIEIEEIESAVANLAEDDLARFRKWFHDYEASVWDQKIEQDIGSGNLDSLADAAIQDFRTGRCDEL